jgi:hypothetical protein
VRGGREEGFTPEQGTQKGKFRFGPGQMRVWARTARPIGGVQAAAPVVTRELALEKEPIKLALAATLVDNNGRLLSGSAPLHVRVIDPLGVVRYDLRRATKQGVFQMTLPLAANDPSGTWKVSIRETLSGKEDTAAFSYKAPVRVRSVVGSSARAVHIAEDREQVFRFARVHRQVSIVKGTGAHNDAAAKRLAKIVEPWGVVCKEVPLADAAKPRTLTEEEARTWCGLSYAGKGHIKPGDKNPPVLAGFALQGPVILLGNPDDNPIIKFLLDQRFLPYRPDRSLPGAGRGMVAWQRDGIGKGQDSVTLIATDEAGMSEAVGTFYELATGMEGLTRWELPESDSLTAAKEATGHHPAAKVAWSVKTPDRVLALKAQGADIEVLTSDGSLTFLKESGKVDSQKPMEPEKIADNLKRLAPAMAGLAETGAAKRQERPDRMMKLWSAGGGRLAVAYWGGTLRIVDEKGATILSEQQLPQDATALAWLNDRLIVGLADGRVLSLAAR